LTDDSLLMPALRYLPGNKGVNISLGYPMRRTSLARLVLSILALQQRKADDGRCYWRDLLHCLRHPYIRMLAVTNKNGKRHFLKHSIRGLEKSLIDAGERYIDIKAHAHVLRIGKKQETDADVALADLLLILDSISSADCLSNLAEGIERLCIFLLNTGGDTWTGFPLDTEILHRFLQDIVPELKYNYLAEEIFPATCLAVVCDSLMREERIPFEAFPLTGLQVLGMLETRLLHFDHIFILDATDDKLPGNPPQDSLLPDSLRAELGLPDAKDQRDRAAYNLHRLCAAAKSVHFYWQEGISHSSLFDGKKSRTRYVEELIWRHEQGVMQKNLIRTAKCIMGDIRRGEPKEIPIEKALRSKLEAFLLSPISPTALDAYLFCPLSFAWKYLFGIKEPKQICEGDDPAAVGNCIHAALGSLYIPRIGRKVSTSDFSDEEMASALAEAMKAHAGHLPADSAIMLETVAPKRLRQFFKRQPETTEIIAVETPFVKEILAGSRDRIRLQGRIDRIDRREGQLYVLDYKTGYCRDKLPREKDFWRDKDFFEALGDARMRESSAPTSCDERESLFSELRERLPSLQLPCYITLLKNDNRGEVGNACLVELYDTGAELPLFKGLDESEMKSARDACELILCFVIGHMRLARSFRAVTGSACRYCSFADLCSVRTDTLTPE
nr:PD-(D/E)XK nuclease family protein [Desulfovibrio sp.]